MLTKLKALVGLSLFILLTFSLTLVALARTSNEDDGLLSNDEVSLAPGGVGLLMTTIFVSTTIDGLNDGDGLCSLREAVAAANNDAPVDGGACPAGSGNDTIILPAGTYFMTDAANTDIDITSTLTIQGAGADKTTLDDNITTRIFDISSDGVATISGVTIVEGDGFTGGAIRNRGILVLRNSVISDSVTVNDGGGILNEGSNSVLTVINSTISFNTALSGGGGGIFNRNGTVTINNSTISQNSADADSGDGVGGGIANSAESSNATLTINQSTITNNTAKGVGGGGISNRADTSRTATVILNRTVVSGNVATATNVLSTTGFGGGIHNSFIEGASGLASSILTLNDSTVSGNTAFNGGGIASISTLITPTLTLKVTLNDSTVSGNTANGLTSTDPVGNGGGLINQNGTMNLVNSTVSGNTATGGTGPVRGLGGGIANSGFTINTTVALSNSTVSNNTAALLDSHALVNLRLGTGTETIFRNTIMAGGCANPNLFGQTGTLTSKGYNIDDGNTCGLTDPTDFINTNPALGPLQDNGDDTTPHTETHALLSTSPAIDAGICSGAPTTDQRGQTRPNAISAFCDIGAYESNSLGTAELQINKVVEPTQADPGQMITYTLTFINNGPAWSGNTVITDVVPLTVTNVASTSSGVTITATNGVTYNWTVGALARGGSGTITITGIISPSVMTGNSFINITLITSDNDSDSDSARVTLGPGGTTSYLPVIVKNSS